MFQSIGKIVYSPRSHIGSNENWAIVSCDDEIGNYYRALYAQAHPPYLNGANPLKLVRPVWGSHISWLRSEKPTNGFWSLLDGQTIEYEYESGVQTNGIYYWMRVHCPALSDIRQRYGLNRNPRFGLHLTIGRAASK